MPTFKAALKQMSHSRSLRWSCRTGSHTKGFVRLFTAAVALCYCHKSVSWLCMFTSVCHESDAGSSRKCPSICPCCDGIAAVVEREPFQTSQGYRVLPCACSSAHLCSDALAFEFWERNCRPLSLSLPLFLQSVQGVQEPVQIHLHASLPQDHGPVAGCTSIQC